MKKDPKDLCRENIRRRDFLLAMAGVLSAPIFQRCGEPKISAQAFIIRAKDYSVDIKSRILAGFKELKVSPDEMKGKRILLKPNLVEPHRAAGHINTHPLVIRGAVDAFYSLGAKQVVIGEGAGHIRDTQLVLEESGMAEILFEDRVPFVDLNNDNVFTTENRGNKSRLKQLTLPETLRQVDWIVSVAKMKTHHWTGVTLSMKNMFGVMPGIFYGFPKNVLHWAGIAESVLDINMTVKPHFAIVDGIVGMEGDGPIMGKPRNAGVMIMGRNLPPVDATCCRIMGINPNKINYLKLAAKFLGPIRKEEIIQTGEEIEAVRNNFEILDKIPAQKGIKM